MQDDDVYAGVHDRVAMQEIELYGEVLSAVAATDRPLTDDELDSVLGVHQRTDAHPEG